MNAKEAHEIHALKLGKLIGNLLTLEMIARMAIVKLDAREAKNIESQLPQMQTGDLVELNSYTNKDDLSNTLKKYNKRVKDQKYKVSVNEIVDLRDALAHGRTFGLSNKTQLRLVKFSKKQEGGKVKVELAQDMTDEWFDKNILMLGAEIEKIRLSLAYDRVQFS